MKDFAKSIRTMNSNKEEIIKKKKEEGATLKVDNGQKLEFSDGTTFVKTSFSDDYREAHNHVGNEAVVLKDGDVWVVLYANETKSKEFDSEAEARAFAKQVGNSKVGNSDARSQAEEAIRKIEDELKKEKPDIKKYFEIERSINKILDDEYNRLTSQASEIRGLQLRIGRMEDKFI